MNGSPLPQQHAEAFVRQALDLIAEGILGLDEQGAIAYANRGAQYLLGLELDDLIGADAHGLLLSRQPDESPALRQNNPLALLKRGGAFCYIEEVLQKKDGTTLDVEMSGMPLTLDASPICTLIILHDISERKRNQEALLEAFQDLDRLNHKLEKAHGQLLQSEKLSSVGQLAAGMAHEINNPIGFVSSNLRSLEKHVQGLMRLIEHYEALERDGSFAVEKLGAIAVLKQSIDFSYLREDVQNLIGESRQGVERVRHIVKNLGDFAHGGNTHNWSGVNLNHCLDSALGVLAHELAGRCELQREYGDIPEIFCLASEINQVFLSILLNAAQSIDSHGHIKISTRLDDDQVIIEIQDSGSGMPPETLPHIFDPFFTTRPVGQGSGLGLSVAYGTVRRHGGDIRIHSMPGEGTRVRISLPVAPRCSIVDKEIRS